MIDSKDRLILKGLREDARKSTAKLSRDLDLPRVTVHERIKKMEERGVIKGYTVIPDHAKLGLPVTAFLLVSFIPGTKVSQRELAGRISKINGIEEVNIISGEWDIMAKVRSASIEDIGDLILDKLRDLDGVGKSITCVSFSTVKEER